MTQKESQFILYWSFILANGKQVHKNTDKFLGEKKSWFLSENFKQKSWTIQKKDFSLQCLSILIHQTHKNDDRTEKYDFCVFQAQNDF